MNVIPLLPLPTGFLAALPPPAAGGGAFLAALEAAEASGPVPAETSDAPVAAADHPAANAAPPAPAPKGKKAPPPDAPPPLWAVAVPAAASSTPPPVTMLPPAWTTSTEPAPQEKLAGEAAAISADAELARPRQETATVPIPAPEKAAAEPGAEPPTATPKMVPPPPQPLRHDTAPTSPAPSIAPAPRGDQSPTTVAFEGDLPIPAADADGAAALAVAAVPKRPSVPAQPEQARRPTRVRAPAEQRETLSRGVEQRRDRTESTPRTEAEHPRATAVYEERPEPSQQKREPVPSTPVAVVDETPDAAPTPSRNDGAPARPLEKAQLAFGARLTPAPPVEAVAAAAPENGQRDNGAGRENATPEESTKPRAVRAAAEDIAPPQTSSQEPTVTIQAPARDAGPRADATPEKAPEAAPVRHAAAPQEKPLAPPVARDIRVEVAGEERRVEVRLVERAGQVQFAVRTPDDSLAGTLREHLPSLSARLEQSGFRADQWHVAEAGGTERRLEMPASAQTAGQGAEQDGRGRENRDQRQQQQPQDRRQSQEKGKAFEWLMQSLR